MQDRNLFRDDFQPIGPLSERLVREVVNRQRQRLHLSVPPNPEARQPTLPPLARVLAVARARLRAIKSRH